MEKFIIKKRKTENIETAIPNEKSNNNEENEDCENNLIKKTTKDRYQENWKRMFDWLKTEEQDGKIYMFCMYCQKSKKRNPFGSGGCTSYKASALKRHGESNDHRQAIKDQTGKKDMKKAIMNVVDKNKDFLICCLKTAMFTAINELPNSMVGQLQDFLSQQGCHNAKSGSSVQYKHSDSVNDLHEALASVIKNELLENLKAANFFSLICDESCDLANSKHLGINVRFLKNGEVCTQFLENTHVKDGTAVTIVESIAQVLEECEIPLKKVVALGCDGANVMLGSKGGVSALLQKQNSYLIAIHCAAHRLALVLQHATKDVPSIKSYSETLKTIFIFFNASAVRSERLKQIQILLDSPVLKYAELHSVRWLAMHDAVQCVFRTLDALIVFLESEISEGRGTIAKGILKAVKSINFVYITHILMDILPILTNLSKIFQKDVADFSVIKPCTTLAIHKLNELKENIGKFEQYFIDFVIGNNERTDFENDDLKISHSYYTTVKEHLKNNLNSSSAEFLKEIKHKLIDAILEGFNKRFTTKTLDILEAFAAYDASNLKIIGLEEGKKLVNQLQVHYEDIKLLESLSSEYEDVFNLLMSSYTSLKFKEVVRIFIEKYAELFPSTILMFEIILVVPITSAPTERSFSTQNRIKTKYRNRLRNDVLNNLIRISDSHLSIENFNYSKAAEYFNEKVLRRY